MGAKKPLKAKRLSDAVRLCAGAPETVADKLKYARLAAGLKQDELADMVGIDRITLIRYENGQIEERHMQTEWLVKIALACGLDKYACCSPYHVFIAEDAGGQIRRYRKARGLTVKALATELGVSGTTIKRWEQNKNKPPVSVWELVSSLKSMD